MFHNWFTSLTSPAKKTNMKCAQEYFFHLLDNWFLICTQVQFSGGCGPHLVGQFELLRQWSSSWELQPQRDWNTRLHASWGCCIDLLRCNRHTQCNTTQWVQVPYEITSCSCIAIKPIHVYIGFPKYFVYIERGNSHLFSAHYEYHWKCNIRYWLQCHYTRQNASYHHDKYSHAFIAMP